MQDNAPRTRVDFIVIGPIDNPAKNVTGNHNVYMGFHFTWADSEEGYHVVATGVLWLANYCIMPFPLVLELQSYSTE